MKIIVCIKPIRSKILYPNEQRNEGYVINPYDLFGLEEVLRLKKDTNCSIICLGMGNAHAKQAMVRCLAMGADQAILLSDDQAFAQSDTVATSRVLARAIRRIGQYDLIVCGRRSVDGETGQVKYGLSELLGVNLITNVDKIVYKDDHSLTVRVHEEKYTDVREPYFPLMISFRGVSMGSDAIGLMSLKNAYRTVIPIWSAGDLDIPREECGKAGSRTEVIGSTDITRRSQCTFISGSDTEKTEFIRTLLHD